MARIACLSPLVQLWDLMLLICPLNFYVVCLCYVIVSFSLHVLTYQKFIRAHEFLHSKTREFSVQILTNTQAKVITMGLQIFPCAGKSWICLSHLIHKFILFIFPSPSDHSFTNKKHIT
jgi:hypothetical protein